MIELINVTKQYSNVTVLKNVTLKIRVSKHYRWQN